MDKDVLAHWLAQGLSLAEIGTLVGRHPSTVGYWVRKHGLQAAGLQRHRGRKPLERDVLEALVREDQSIRQIAAAVDRSPGTVRHWLGAYGLKTTDAARLRRSSRPSNGVCRVHGPTRFIVRKDGSSSCARCRAASVVEWRRRAKRTLVAEMGGACRRCGYSRSLAALQFHHVDPQTKLFGLGRAMSSSMESLRAEAQKCVLLCANCHAEVEHGLGP